MWWRIETCSRWIGEQEYRSVRFDLETLSSGTLNRPEFLSTLTILPLEVEDEKRFRRATPPPPIRAQSLPIGDKINKPIDFEK